MILWLTEKFYKVVPWFWVIATSIWGIGNFILLCQEKSPVSWGRSFGYIVLILIMIYIFEKNWKILVARSKAKTALRNRR
jgi:hypothetical protein